jgi:hypothetical protein
MASGTQWQGASIAGFLGAIDPMSFLILVTGLGQSAKDCPFPALIVSLFGGTYYEL